MVRPADAPVMSGTDESSEFVRFLGGVRSVVDARLAAWLGERVALARSRGAPVASVADAVAQLALRGGKRMRAVLLAASYVGCGGEGGIDRTAMAGVAIELLQTYLLVHDDWMDGDAVRRGGPSVPALMRGLFDGARADAASVLAGDLASAWSQRRAPRDRPARRAGRGRFARARARRGGRRRGADARRPGRRRRSRRGRAGPRAQDRQLLHAGARADGRPAGRRERRAGSGLAAYAEPLGVAFQLRDDVLGTFGDAGVMGKPAGSDLRAGKRTALVVEALRGRAGREARSRACSGGPTPSDEDVREAMCAIEACGARERVEARIGALAARLARRARARDSDRGGAVRARRRHRGAHREEGLMISLGQACGKVILLGEHAVVHGVPALAVGIDRGARAQATPMDQGPSRLFVRGWDIMVRETDQGHDLARAFRALLDAAHAARAAVDRGGDRPAARRRPRVLGGHRRRGRARARAAADRRRAAGPGDGLGVRLSRQPERRRRGRRRAGRVRALPPGAAAGGRARPRPAAPLHRQHGDRVEHQGDGRGRGASAGPQAGDRRQVVRGDQHARLQRAPRDRGGRLARPRAPARPEPDASRGALRVDARDRADVRHRARRRGARARSSRARAAAGASWRSWRRGRRPTAVIDAWKADGFSGFAACVAPETRGRAVEREAVP